MKKFKDYAIILSGAAVYALSVVVFTSPNNIAPGGLTGVGTLLNYLYSVPIGTFILIMNVPLFLTAFRSLGRNFLLKTVAATVLVSVLIDFAVLFVSPYSGDVMLAALFGGILNGGGLALIFSRGGSTGGTDIIAALVHRRFPQFSVGHVILACDAVVVCAAGIIYGNPESALYAVVSIFVSSKIIDVITYGTSRDNGKLMFVITSAPEAILDAILNDVSRGVTVFDAFGGYSGRQRTVLMCALRPRQVFKTVDIVKKNDKNAFVIVTTAGVINGFGFSKM